MYKQYGSLAFARATETLFSFSARAHARRKFCESRLFSWRLFMLPFFLVIFLVTFARLRAIIVVMRMSTLHRVLRI